MKNLNFQIAKYFAVLWPVGFFPFAPGTIASLFAAYLGYLTNIYLGSIFTLLINFKVLKNVIVFRYKIVFFIPQLKKIVRFLEKRILFSIKNL